MQNTQLPDPIFVLGTQRSGTTLLSRIMSAHKGLFIQNELPIGSIFKKMSAVEILNGINQNMIEIHGIDLHKVTTDKIRWGLKEPYLTFHTDKLKKYFSKSKYILIVRDPRAVTLSYINNKWGLATNAYTGGQRWKKEVSLQLNFAKSPGIDCKIIRYEDIVRDLESSCHELCEFLEIPFDSNMMSYHQLKTDFALNKSNINTTKKIDKRSADKFSKLFSDRELGAIELECKDLMSELGYEPLVKHIELSKWEKTYYRFHQAILGGLQHNYRWYKHKLTKLIKK